MTFRSRFRPESVFLSLFFVLIAGLLLDSLRADWRGGGFVLVVLATTTGFMGWMAIQELLKNPAPADNVVEGNNDLPSQSLAVMEQTLDWGSLGRACGYSLLFCLMFLFLGIYVGGLLFLFGYLRLARGTGMIPAALISLFVGLGIPYFFSSVLGLRAWTGAIPVLLPGWMGGGFLPPF